MKKFLGKLEDLTNIKSTSYNGKVRYYCPYCDTVHGKNKDKEGCLVFNNNTLSGYCFRCGTVVTHDGLKDLNYIKEKIQKENFNKESRRNVLKIDWLKLITQNTKALEYMFSRHIRIDTLIRFNVMASDEPLGVFFINEILDKSYTDFMQGRFIDHKEQKHYFIKNTVKPLCWLHLANSPTLILCEGFTDGLSAYQHGKYIDQDLNPVILGGKTLTEEQIKILQDYCSKHEKVSINVCMDGGFFEDTLKIANKVYNKCYNAEVFVINMPYQRDLNEVSSKTFNKLFSKRLEFEPSKIQHIRNLVYNGTK